MIDKALVNFNDSLQKNKNWCESVFIYEKLSKEGYLCWIAGGAVRDIYLGREPKDFDLVTDANEHDIMRLFPQAVLVGRQFGVFKIPLSSGNLIDLAYFRKEKKYTDGRRPSEIEYGTPEEDAYRRDFTVNSLYWDIKNQQLIDYVGGLLDLKNSIIKCVGNPDQRFNEDYLRILRLLRFSYELNFSIDLFSYESAQKFSELTKKVSGERFFSELIKINEKKKRFQLYQDKLFFDIMKHNDIVLNESRLTMLSQTVSENNISVDLLVLFEILLMSQFQEESYKKISSRFKLSNEQKKWISKVLFIFKHFEVEPAELTALIEMDQEKISILELLQEYNVASKSSVMSILHMINKKIPHIIELRELKGLVPDCDIKKCFIEIRKKQYRGELDSKKQAVDFIQNNWQIIRP